MTQQRRRTFFPCRLRRHSSRDKKPLLSCPAPSGCAVDRLRPTDRHRGRNGAARERKTETYNGDHRHLLEERLERVHRRHRHPQRPGQERTHRPRPARHRRERSQPPGPGRPRRDRRRLVQALQRGPRLSGPQARRSELQRPDLRQPLRRRGRRYLLADLVPPERAARRLRPPRKAPAGRSGPFSFLATESADVSPIGFAVAKLA